MFYLNLKEIVKHIEKTVSCAGCSEKFLGDKLEILCIHGSRVAVIGYCEKCGATTTIIISEETPKARSITIKKRLKPTKGKIEMNDILDIKTYLNSFQGNFKDLLK